MDGSSLPFGVRIIDVDSHVTEPADLWTSRISSKWGDDIPRVVRWDVTGEEHWTVAGDILQPVAMSAMAGYSRPVPDYPSSLEEADPGAYDPVARLARLDEYGIYAQVLFPNVLAFFPQWFMKLDPDLSLQCVRAYNDYVSEFASADPERLLPITMVPFWDVEASVAEIERCAERNHRGVLLTAVFEAVKLPNLQDPHWAPILEVCQSIGQSLNFHAGFAGVTAEALKFLQSPRLMPKETFAAIGAVSFMSTARHIAIITTLGVCHRYPDLKFVSTESGFGFIPYMLEATDWQFENAFLRKEHPDWLLPSEYFKRQVYGTVWFEDMHHDKVVEFQDNIMFETDYPHPTSLTPGPNSISLRAEEMAARNFGGLPEPLVRKILQDNAAELYRVRLPEVASR